MKESCIMDFCPKGFAQIRTDREACQYEKCYSGYLNLGKIKLKFMNLHFIRNSIVNVFTPSFLLRISTAHLSPLFFSF